MQKRKAPAKRTGSIGVYIGTHPQTIEAAHRAISDILDKPHCDQETKRAALDSLKGLAAVPNTSLTNCTITT